MIDWILCSREKIEREGGGGLNKKTRPEGVRKERECV